MQMFPRRGAAWQGYTEAKVDVTQEIEQRAQQARLPVAPDRSFFAPLGTAFCCLAQYHLGIRSPLGRSFRERCIAPMLIFLNGLLRL